ncbi:C-type mannose receptor 2-like [Chelmon rostratus]|uniref:C-type mannose receptor 2-like n=1 Tax=Chelmon rostratus TaxID=109905 RepID=UPI001BEBF477|nr:C-type mannose receptor 2-like [Chelmon rostratus]
MDEAVIVMLLLTGFFVPSASSPNIYYFIRQKMSWDEAQVYCLSEHTQMAQIHNMENVTTIMNTPAGGYADKAWIGLFENTADWTWVDGQPATYSMWSPGQPDNVNADEFCVCLTNNGSWKDSSCSEMKPAVCVMEDSSYTITMNQMTWTDAKTHCEEQGAILATFPDEKTSIQIDGKTVEAWIGLSRPKLWYWSETGENYKFTNWQPKQPDNLNGEENCAAVVVKDGTWTDEQCNTTLPFFCYGVYKSRKTVVRMKIQSSANLEDPAHSASLQQQLHAAFANWGAADFKLTWKQLPVKQAASSDD